MVFCCLKKKGRGRERGVDQEEGVLHFCGLIQLLLLLCVKKPLMTICLFFDVVSRERQTELERQRERDRQSEKERGGHKHDFIKESYSYHISVLSE